MEMTLTWKCFLNVRLMDVKFQDFNEISGMS